MIVRELVGLLKIKTDEQSMKKANTGMTGLLSNMAGMIAKVTAAYASARGILGIIELASDANETLNVMTESFHENTEAVKDWANEFGKTAGRSEYAMRDIAGQFGAVLNPMMDGNSKAAADMSAGLSELVVDLGSFFNAAEPEVLLALRSGLIGLPQAMFKFGVVMRQANLETFRLKLGIKKTYQEMNQAEKTALRYNFILDQTKAAQGDAARTAGGWANKSKALVSQLKDVGTRIGLTFLPAAEMLLGVMMSLIDAFVTIKDAIKWMWEELDPAARNIIKVAGAIRILQLALTRGPLAAFAALIILIALIIDDLRTFGQGGESVIGDFIESLDYFKIMWQEVKDAIHEAWLEVKKFWDLLMKSPASVLNKIFGEGSAEALGAAFGGGGVPAPHSIGDTSRRSAAPGLPGPYRNLGLGEDAPAKANDVFGDRNMLWENKISITIGNVDGKMAPQKIAEAVRKEMDSQYQRTVEDLSAAKK